MPVPVEWNHHDRLVPETSRGAPGAETRDSVPGVAQFDAAVAESFRAQAAVEAADRQSFEEFLSSYSAQLDAFGGR